MRKLVTALLAVALIVPVTMAGEAPAGEPVPEAPKASPPPLPLQTLEGFSGVYLTDTAYMVNPPEADGFFGKPSIAISGVRVGQKDLESLAVTTNIMGRLEFGYSFQRLGLGDWPHDIMKTTGIDIDHSSLLHTVGLRAMVLREGEGDTTWMPAFTIGVRYKKNATIAGINRDLAQIPRTLGYSDDDGLEYTATLSKTFVGVLPKPFILSVGLRNTDAIHAGFVGFSDDRHTVFEANGIFFLTDRLVFAAEYRQMPDELKGLKVAGTKLIMRQDDWWSMALGYVFNNNVTGTLGFANLGRVLNHDENICLLGQVKCEF